MFIYSKTGHHRFIVIIYSSRINRHIVDVILYENGKLFLLFRAGGRKMDEEVSRAEAVVSDCPAESGSSRGARATAEVNMSVHHSGIHGSPRSTYGLRGSSIPGPPRYELCS